MNDRLTADLAALQARAGLDERRAALEAFRADFAAVWRNRRIYGYPWGYLSALELPIAYAAASTEIRAHMGDADWMAAKAAEYRTEAEAIARDTARRERIANEVRTERAQLTKGKP